MHFGWFGETLADERQMLYTVTAALVITCCFHGAGQHRDAIEAKDVMMGTKVHAFPAVMVQSLMYHVAALLHRPILLLRLLRPDQSQHLRHHAANL